MNTTGKKFAGRKAGVPNKKTVETIQNIEQSGLTPLQFLLEIMRDVVQEPAARIDAAKAAAPYVHPKLANIEHGNLNNVPFYVKLLSSDNDL